MTTQHMCLCIIYNHRYDINIEKLEKIYDKRFSKIYHIVPFYDGDKENVITVYESSHQFQGYISQAMEHIWSEEFDDYLFIGDDLILNPMINENNIHCILGISEQSSFLPDCTPLSKMNGWDYVGRIYNSYQAFCIYSGTNYKTELWSPEEAYGKVLKDYKKEDFIITKDNFKSGIHGFWNRLITTLKYYRHVKLVKKGWQLPYPLFGGYSDILLLNQKDLKRVGHHFGVMAAIGLFVEIAIPTVMKLDCERLESGNHKSNIMWTDEEKIQIETDYQRDIQYLFDHWPSDVAYMHPIKLSRWKM